MSWPPHITVAVVVEEDGRFLVVEENINGKAVLNQPAGHLEPGESLFDAAKREALEETAWQIELTGLVGIYHYSSSSEGTTFHRITFAARAISETNGDLDPDITAVHWLTPDEIKVSATRSPLVTLCIEDHLERPPVPLSFLKHL